MKDIFCYSSLRQLTARSLLRLEDAAVRKVCYLNSPIRCFLLKEIFLKNLFCQTYIKIEKEIIKKNKVPLPLLLLVLDDGNNCLNFYNYYNINNDDVLS